MIEAVDLGPDWRTVDLDVVGVVVICWARPLWGRGIVAG